MITLFSMLLQGVGDWPWATLGVGGVLAGIMFYFYRQDRKASEEKYGDLARDFRQIVQDNTRSITMNTNATQELIRVLDREREHLGGA